MYLGEIKMQLANGIILELLFQSLALLITGGQATDVMAMKTAVRGRAAQVGNSFLERVEAVMRGKRIC